MNGGHEPADGGSDGHNDQGGHQGGDGDVDQERTIPVMLLTMQQMIKAFQINVTAANERADRAERRAEELQALLARKDAEHHDEKEKLIEEAAEHRRNHRGVGGRATGSTTPVAALVALRLLRTRHHSQAQSGIVNLCG